MEKTNIKLTLSIILVALIIIAPIISKAADTTNSGDAVILEKSESEKIIYAKDVEDKEFKYAFSNSDDSTSVTYVTATKDSNGKYVAILDDGNTYKNMFVMVDGNTSTINLENAKTINDEEIEKVEQLTKRIGVKTDEEETSTANSDGTSITTTVGKIVVTDNGKYQYQIIEILDKNNSTPTLNSTAAELYNQLDALKNAATTLDKLVAEITIRDDYQKLLDNATWTDAKNGTEILQPENSIKDEKFLVLIKEIDENGNTVKTDVQFMTCDREDAEGKAETEKQVEKKVEVKTKLPVTGENLAIYIALAVVILAIIILAIKMRKEKAHDNEKK